jgi:hypothetical protein
MGSGDDWDEGILPAAPAPPGARDAAALTGERIG